MQERTVLSGMDLKAYLGRLRQNPKYTEEIVKLIEDDLRFGLTKEETEEYSGGRYDYRQMCVYSRCLRNGYNEQEKAAILKEGLSGDQMAVALEFYEKGVPMATITEVLSSAENTAYTMKRLFSQVLKKIREAEPVNGQDTAYAKELMEQIREVVEKISCQEKRYDALNEKLKEIGTAGQDVQVQSNLIRFVPVERMERKDRGSVMTSMFSRLFLKKKTDIVKLLAEKDLSPEQLVQVRSAIEKGLSEKQLLVLINNKIPAEQMEEIINIAVYENKMKEGQ